MRARSRDLAADLIQGDSLHSSRNDPTPDLDDWDPLSPTEAAQVFAPARFVWWIGGGWAIDLYVGRRTRRHRDLDIGVLRRDQRDVAALLSGWQLWAADPPGSLRRWDTGEHLPAGTHDVWCRRNARAPWSIQLQLNESADRDWVYRRDPSVRRRLDALTLTSSDGIPFLSPDVQLLFKAKAPRPEDDADLRVCVPLLDREQRRWLHRHLPRDHPWRTAVGTG